MATLNNLPHSYSEAELFLGKRDSAKCGHNTLVAKSAEFIDDKRIVTYYVQYYNIAIATFYPDDSIKIHTKGYHSNTTKARLNRMLWPSPWGLYSSKGKWHWWNTNIHNDFLFREGDRVFLRETKLFNFNAIYEDIQSTGYGLMCAVILARM